MKKTKYIFVVGGVISGVGKGITTSSIALLLRNKGYKVSCIKIDPYINVDAGTMNPTEHGEVFVLADGDECDQDMGNYERFLNTNLNRDNYMTTGRVYSHVINAERSMEYKGKTVEVIPHIPVHVIERIKKVKDKQGSDVVIIEIGGTVGEYQNMIFIEALRMMKSENKDDVLTVLVSYLPSPATVGEMKTKPTQQAVRNLQSAGVNADIIVARSTTKLDQKRKEKISQFCNIGLKNIISAPDVSSIYDVPGNFENDGMTDSIIKILKLKKTKKETSILKGWKGFFKIYKKEVHIAVVGKYFSSGDFVLSDAYVSVLEALKYAGYKNKVKVKIDWISSQDFESGKVKLETLKKYGGVLIPGGFGSGGVEGKLKVIQYIRENNIPFLGICYGMQLAVIEYSRNILKIKDAHTTEIDKKTRNPVIDIQESQKINLENNKYGNSMRLGNYICDIKKKTILHKIYKKESVTERHRHRYEVNNNYIKLLEEGGLVFSGINKENSLIEAIELPTLKHKFFVAVQYHPEFLARPISSHPLFDAFVKSCI
jgi:CTP synthase